MEKCWFNGRRKRSPKGRLKKKHLTYKATNKAIKKRTIALSKLFAQCGVKAQEAAQGLLNFSKTIRKSKEEQL